MKALNEDERKELLGRINEAHGRVSAALSELRRRYSAKAAVVKAAAKAERDVFALRRELEKLEGGAGQPAASLPEVRRGGKVVDLGELGGRGGKRA